MIKFTKSIFVMFAICLIVCGVFFSAGAQAKDSLQNFQADAVTFALDKNGNEYARIIVQEERNIEGQKYTTGVAVMAFGLNAEKIKASGLVAGDEFRAIVSEGEWQGRKNYTIIDLVGDQPVAD